MRELSNNGAQAGFTLFELLVVISIMAILLGLAIPSLNIDSGKGAFADFERMLTGGVSEARYLSMITGKVQVLSLKNEGVIKVSPSGLDKARMPDGYEITSMETIDGRREKDFSIRFYPGGLAESCVIHVRNNYDERSFYVPPISEVRVEQGVVALGRFQE